MNTLCQQLKRNKKEIAFFLSIFNIYSIIYLVFFFKTTIFYNTHSYDTLLDTDTGILFDSDVFVTGNTDIKHPLFRGITSILCFIPRAVAIYGYQLFKINPEKVYGLGLFAVQCFISCISITLIFKYLRNLSINKITTTLVIGLMIFSFPQVFFTLNLERFIYAQFSLVLFIFIVQSGRHKESKWDGLASILLIGVTLTNIYIYAFNLLLEYKTNIKAIAVRVLKLILLFYIGITITNSITGIFNAHQTFDMNSKYFIESYTILQKAKLTITNLLYPSIYFPGHYINDRSLVQSPTVNVFCLALIVIVIVLSFISIIINKKDRIVQICALILGFNIFMHGIVGYNLKNSNINTPHFNFAIIILLAWLSKDLKGKKLAVFNTFILVILITSMISNFNGFTTILNLGMKYYPYR